MSEVTALPSAEHDGDLLAGPQMIQQAGCTYRQLDYWHRAGLIHAAHDSRGTGYPRLFTRAELVVLRRMVALVRVGMHPQTAAYAARNGYRTWLSDTVQVCISPLTVRILPGWRDPDGPKR